MEHRRSIGAYARGKEHIAKLRAGGIRDDPLDIRLHQTDRRSKNGSGGPDDGDEIQRELAGLEQGREPADHKHTGGHHSGGMDQRGDRRWPLHRVRQPCMETQLSGFAHRSDEQQDAQQAHRIHPQAEETDARTRLIRRSGQNFRDRNRPEHQKHTENPEHEAQIANPVDDKGLDRRSACAGLAEPETDQKIGCQADAFPTEEHLHKIIRRNQHQHGKGEQREIGEEPRLIRVFVHITPAVEMHERRDAGDHDQHDCGQCVNAQRPVEIETARAHPHHDGLHIGAFIAGHESQEDGPAERAGHKQCPRRQHLGGYIADGSIGQSGNNRREQRQKYDDLNHGARQPFIRLTSSTAMVPRPRK